MGEGIRRVGARRPPGYGNTGRVSRDFPEPDHDERVVEYDPRAWPRKAMRESMLVPTVCFNCESACGLLAYVDTDTFEIRKLEGHPGHPGSRGRNCAKGPATLNQITDPERLLYPMRRSGPRGCGQWERVSWDHVLDTFAERMHDAFAADRPNDVCGLEETVTKVSFDGSHLPLTGRPDTIAALVDGLPRRGFNTPSRKLELYSETLAEWGWEELRRPPMPAPTSTTR
jgi:Molybdopterin oxidoreductase Fe4S4 domain